MARLSHQHYRYARARGLYDGSGAEPARARRCRRRVRLGGRRAAAVRDGLAAGRPLRRPPHRLHQQDGPHRRELLRRGAVDARPAGRPRGAGADPDRPGGAPPRRRRPRRDEGDRLRGRAGSAVHGRRGPGRARRAGGRVPPRADRLDRRARRRADGGLPHGREHRDAGDDPQGPARRHPRRRAHPRPARLRVQEQGRAAATRRGDRLPAQPARRAGGAGCRPEDRRGDHPARFDGGAVLRARVQGHVGPVRREADLLPRLLRPGQDRRPGAQRDERQDGAHRPDPADAREPSRGAGGDRRRRDRRCRGPQAVDHR